MTLSEPVAPGPSAAFLTEQWRTTSLATVWRHPGDWHGPAVSALVRAVVAGDGIEDAAAALGSQRAASGVGVVEALDDLAVLFTIVSGSPPPFAVSRDFAREWVEQATSALLGKATVDPLTGLVTRDYLMPRVREVYADAAVRGIRADDERCLLVIDRCEGAPGWQRVMREGMVGRVLSTVLDRGQTNSVLPSGTFLSLVHRDDALDEHVVRIRRALSSDGPEGARQPSIRIEPLPATVAEAEKLLLGL